MDMFLTAIEYICMICVVLLIVAVFVFIVPVILAGPDGQEPTVEQMQTTSVVSPEYMIECPDCGREFVIVEIERIK
jgi:hypothetical protein